MIVISVHLRINGYICVVGFLMCEEGAVAYFRCLYKSQLDIQQHATWTPLVLRCYYHV